MLFIIIGILVILVIAILFSGYRCKYVFSTCHASLLSPVPEFHDGSAALASASPNAFAHSTWVPWPYSPSRSWETTTSGLKRRIQREM